MIINLSWNGGAGKMTLDLDALLNDDAITVYKLMGFVKDQAYENPEALTATVDYLESEIELYYMATLTAEENFKANPQGSYAWRRYKREVINCGRIFRRLHKALNIVTGKPITLDERIDIIKKRVG